jgi:hypothetical protein
MPMNKEKRTIDDYEVKQSLKIGGIEVILAENAKSSEPFMVCNCSRNNPLGMAIYSNAITENDYLKILSEYISRISRQIEKVKSEREEVGIPLQILTKDDCIPNSHEKDFEDKIVIIKPEKLSPEYRTVQEMAVIATGGFGCSSKARGQAVFTENIFTGEKSRWERSDIAGIADAAKLPKLVQEKIIEFEKAGKIKQEP